MDDYNCRGCGQQEDYCQCDKEAEGYECQDCGYTPTWKELNRGSCPECRAFVLT